MASSSSFSWTQSEDAVEVQVPLMGCKASNVALHVTDVYIKLNYPPRVLVIDLHGEVDFQSAAAKAESGTLVLALRKRSPGTWPVLQAEGSKQELGERRAAADARKAQVDAEIAKAVHEDKREREQLAFKKQMQLEEARRQRLDDEKAAVKLAAQEDVLSSLASVAEADAKSRAAAAGSRVAGYTAPAEDEDEDAVEFIPAPRSASQQGGNVLRVDFSDRPFPTPLRESRKEEESTWLAKHKEQIEAHARRQREGRGEGANSLQARDVSERDAQWLKERGDTFYASQDFLGAINAYSAALLQQSSLLAARSNRAACHLQRGHAHVAILDCSQALAEVPTVWDGDALPAEVPVGVWTEARSSLADVAVVGAVAMGREAPPAPPAAGSSRASTPAEYAVFRSVVRILSRRAAGFCQSGHYTLARKDLVCGASVAAKASKLPDAPATPVESMDAELLLEDADFMLELESAWKAKLEGDTACGAGQWDEALEKYTQAVDASDGLLITALLNRSAAFVAKDDFPSAVDDCTAAMKVLVDQGTDLLSPVPPAPSDAARQLKGAVLARRGLLLATLRLWDDALSDLRSAVAISPKDADLRADMQLVASKVAIVETSAAVPGAAAS